MLSIIIRSILAKLRSNSLFALAGISTPNLESSNCSLKKLVEGGSNPSMSFELSVVTPLAPTDCQGVVKLLYKASPSFLINSVGMVSSAHSYATFKNCSR